jgi:DNA-binding LacI/PurR family transcriptional regulator
VEQPLYRHIYDDLARKINTGEIGYMEQIPVLAELCQLYGVSEAPVRRALDELSREGWIVKKRRQGTFVIRRPAHQERTFTARLLLMGDFDLERSALEVCHEVFDLLAGVRDAAREQGVRLQQVSQRGLEHLSPPGPNDGYIIIGMGEQDYRDGVRLANGAPCVLLNAPGAIALPNVVSVRVDMEMGAFLGVNYLAQLGHRRIAHIGNTKSEWTRPRFSGYQRALAANGLVFDSALVCETGGIGPQEEEAAFDQLRQLENPPTAIFTASDYRALHLLAPLRRAGYSVPWTLSLCGYDDISEAESIIPALTTVRHPRYELGDTAISLLRNQLSGLPIADSVVRPELIVRDSCTSPSRPANRESVAAASVLTR